MGSTLSFKNEVDLIYIIAYVLMGLRIFKYYDL